MISLKSYTVIFVSIFYYFLHTQNLYVSPWPSFKVITLIKYFNYRANNEAKYVDF